MSKKSKKVKKSFADQLREILGIEQKKRGDDSRHFESDAASSMPTQATRNADTAPIKAHSDRPTQPRQVPSPASPRSESRIIWGSSTKPQPIERGTGSPIGGKIEWTGVALSGQFDPSTLIGVEDAFDHSPLLPGERVAFCSRDKVAYHFETWEFLRSQNQGRCCICGQSIGIQMLTLPGTLVGKPLPVAPAKPQVVVLPGERVIGLKEVPDHLYQAVIVQDYVDEVYCTKSTGSYFVRFEPRSYGEKVFSGFKVVIFYNYVSRWTDMGLRVEDYQHRYIRVRGVVQQHPTWGTEILVNSPRVIEVVDGPKSH